MNSQLNSDQKEETTRIAQGNVAVAGSPPFSGDEGYEANAPSPKKSRGARKKVISVAIGEADGSSRSRTEIYPPSDFWSWRKYGQKPIKGSPYPRAYYRCSSSKSCPARKQVERNHQDPTMLLVTYNCDHNHSLPTTTKNHHYHHHPSPTSGTSPAASDTACSTAAPLSSKNADAPTEVTLQEEFGVSNPESKDSSFSQLVGELGWCSNVGSTLLDSSTLVGPGWSEVDMPAILRIREEDESLFGDLGELPECSAVFPQFVGEKTPCCAGSG